MTATPVLIAELRLDERAPERSGARLIEWAAVCGASGVILPRAWQATAPADALRQATAALGLAWHEETPPSSYVDRNADPEAALQGLLNAALRRAPALVKALSLNRSLGGAPHRDALYPDEFAGVAETVRQALASADGVRARVRAGAPGPWVDPQGSPPSAGEAETERLAFRRALPKGSVLADGDLKTVRGGAGLSAELTPRVIGSRLLYDGQAGEPVTFGLLSPWDGPRRSAEPRDVSVVIRVKNEAAWLRRSLSAVVHQSCRPRDIIVVDNASSDGSAAVAAQYGCRVVPITNDEFSFGRALNRGIAAASGEWVASLSAHSVPVDDGWLKGFLVQQRASPFLAACYGRQEPLPESSDFDKRDLWTTFGVELRLQRGQDHFFHNANSLIRRAVWARIPFDEALEGVEDRDWAKKVLADGHIIRYTPRASVHHYHGIHQGRNEARARRVVQVIELIQQRVPADSLSGLSR